MSGRVTRYELGTSEPDFTTASKLAKKLGVPLAYLLADNDALADIIPAAASMSLAKQRKMAAEFEGEDKALNHPKVRALGQEKAASRQQISALRSMRDVRGAHHL